MLVDALLRVAKLADMGLARLLMLPMPSSEYGIHGTPGYKDPIYISTGEYTAASDVYSFGVVLL